MKNSILYVLFVSISFLGCNAEDNYVNDYDRAVDLNDHFAREKIEWDRLYNYKELLTHKQFDLEPKDFKETRVNGTIIFVKPNIVEETYKSILFKSTIYFKADTQELRCDGWHETPGSFLINEPLSRGRIRYKDGETYIMWSEKWGDTYYVHRLILD